jgi:hypothetical protein
VSTPAALEQAQGRPRAKSAGRNWISGFCSTERHASEAKAAEWHQRCKGAFDRPPDERNGNARRVALCSCPEHDTELRCCRCGHSHLAAVDFDPLFRECADTEACIARQLAQREVALNSDQVRMLNECLAAGRAERAARTAEREQRAAQAAESTREPVQVTGDPATPRRGATKKSGRAPRQCLCGCGGMTKGGRFLPGHDAKYHAAQKRLAQEGT